MAIVAWIAECSSFATRRAKLSAGMRVTTAAPQRVLDKNLLPFLCLVSWLIPGAGHLWLRRTQKGLVFIIVVPLMFLIGLWLDGRIFPFDLSQPLVALAAFADLGIGLPYFLAWMLGQGTGTVVEASYEYGNTFLIVSGLLNMLLMLDAYDVALGRK
jgi:hypothetical protein